MNRHDAIEIAYQIPGWMWPTELGWLWDSFSASRSHLEIGTYCGKSLWVTAATMREGRLVAIDPIVFGAPGKEWVLEVLGATQRLIKKHTSVQVEFLEMGYVEALREGYAKQWKFDSAFLDGDHGYAETRGAIESCLPLMKPGGVIAGHDYGVHYLGVMRSVDECFEKFEVASGTRIWRAKSSVAISR